MGKRYGMIMRIWRNGEGQLNDRRTAEYNISVNLVFDSSTKIVYYKFKEQVAVDRYNYEGEDTRVGYMSPYVGDNGRFCKFIDNQIIEIN